MAASHGTGWKKHQANPVLGGKLGTCFDVSVLVADGTYAMYFSWRPKKSVALVRGRDGIAWDAPRIVLAPNPKTSWEGRINRPSVLKRADGYHMWYTGQSPKQSWIGYATSADGVTWKRSGDEPVLSPEAKWEKVAVMCPHVIWDAEAGVFRMWYSGGDQYEPNAIGYATSRDGRRWEKHAGNPVFRCEPSREWERHKVTACQVVRQGKWHYMFYIGFRDEHRAQIGLARSRDGISSWQRFPGNPILAPDAGRWDADACYKPFAVLDGKAGRWLLWYNGRHGGSEQIGLAVHEGADLGWDEPSADSPPADASRARGPMVLDTAALKRYVEQFNAADEELYKQYVPNAEAAAFLAANVPLLDCPDEQIEQTYYFRWWTYRKHLKETPDGFVVTEFLPKVSWSGKHNTICCPAGHHFYEGRWLHDAKFLDDYSVFWFRKGGSPRRYSFWAADALWARHLVCPNARLITDLLGDLVANYQAWEKSRLAPEGLFWQIDDRDGMEVSIGGSGYRATINSYMYGDARAIARIARLAGKKDLAAEYDAKADKIRKLVLARLWDEKAKFFKVLPHKGAAPKLADVRELHGYTPWYFHLAGPGCDEAWRQLMDPNGFFAPFGPTTAEQRHPRFAVSYKGHECQWNGPSWPYATSVTLTALANLLNDREQPVIGKADYLKTLKIYTASHRLKRDDGSVVSWIDENLNPHTGDWIARTRLKGWRDGTWDKGKGGKERGKDYNHSTYCDLVITGLIGLRPRDDETVVVNPLLPAGTWDYFCLDNVAYHGHVLTVLWDRTGRRYGKGAGLRVFADGRQIAAAEALGRVRGKLP